jgi:hypothetical protein
MDRTRILCASTLALLVAITGTARQLSAPSPASAADPGPLVGGIAGRVLGGHRVEQVYSDGSAWYLRTARGIHILPIPRAEVVELRWADRDNTLVGRTLFGPGRPSELRTYRIARPEGSTEVPLVPGGDAALPVVALAPGPTASFAFEPAVRVTSLQLRASLDYRQYLASFVHRTVMENGVVRLDEYGSGTADVVVQAVASEALAWPLVLDASHFDDLGARPYTWRLEQIAFDAEERILAVVRIDLTDPGAAAVVPSRRHVWCGEPVCDRPPDVQDGLPVTIPHGFGRGARSIWAVVDVGARRVLHTTAPDPVAISVTTRVALFGTSAVAPGGTFQATEIRLLEADGDAVYTVDGHQNRRTGETCATPPPDVPRVITATVNAGTVAADAVQFTPPIAAVRFETASEQITSAATLCLQSAVGSSPRAAAVVTWEEPRVYLPDLTGAVRVAGRSGRLALLMTLPQGLETGFRGDYHRVVGWDPAAATAAVRHEIREGNRRQLPTASGGLALVTEGSPSSLVVVPLDGPLAARRFTLDGAAARAFRALDPALLFSVTDHRFHRWTRGELQRTALPAPLAPGGPSTGDYHAVGLR